MNRCQYCIASQTHPLFAYIISDRSNGNDKPGTCIGVSRHPFLRLHQHNRIEGFNVVGAKHTKCCEGDWRIELVIGPFVHGDAKQFKKAWRKEARTLSKRLFIGIQKAIQHEHPLSIYIADTRFIKQVLVVRNEQQQQHHFKSKRTVYASSRNEREIGESVEQDVSLIHGADEGDETANRDRSNNGSKQCRSSSIPSFKSKGEILPLSSSVDEEANIHEFNEETCC